MLECSLCEKPSDTYLKGSAKIDGAHKRLVICSGCIDHLNKRIIKKFRPIKQETPVAESDVWSTATWDSD